MTAQVHKRPADALGHHEEHKETKSAETGEKTEKTEHTTSPGDVG